MQILSLLKDEDRLIEAGSLGNTGGFGVDGSNRLSGGDASRVLARVASAAAAMARWGRSRRRRRGGSRSIGRTVGMNEWTGGGGSSGCEGVGLTEGHHRNESIGTGSINVIWLLASKEGVDLMSLHSNSDEWGSGIANNNWYVWIGHVHISFGRVIAFANPGVAF